MTNKHTFEKEYLKFKLNIDVWIKSTNDRIKLLPEAERLSKMSYDEWFEIHKNKLLNNNFSVNKKKIIFNNNDFKEK